MLRVASIEFVRVSDGDNGQLDFACRSFPSHRIPHPGFGQGRCQGRNPPDLPLGGIRFILSNLSMHATGGQLGTAVGFWDRIAFAADRSDFFPDDTGYARPRQRPTVFDVRLVKS
jgi:hypothetical protein